MTLLRSNIISSFVVRPTDAARITERIRRPDFGTLEITLTVDDPKAYTRPWTTTMKQVIVVDSELLDYVCVENEKSV